MKFHFGHSFALLLTGASALSAAAVTDRPLDHPAVAGALVQVDE